MVRGPQGTEQEEIEAPQYSRSTENYCFKDGIKGNSNECNKSKFNQDTVPRIGTAKHFH